jgi:hypothetical protein
MPREGNARKDRIADRRCRWFGIYNIIAIAESKHRAHRVRWSSKASKERGLGNSGNRGSLARHGGGETLDIYKYHNSGGGGGLTTLLHILTRGLCSARSLKLVARVPFRSRPAPQHPSIS